MPPTRKASERFLSIEEARRLLVAGTDRDQMIVLLFMVVRLRPSELFALRVNDLSPGLLRIDEADVPGEPIKSQTKTEDSAADLPLPAGLELALRDYIRRHSLTDLIFPSDRHCHEPRQLPRPGLEEVGRPGRHRCFHRCGWLAEFETQPPSASPNDGHSLPEVRTYKGHTADDAPLGRRHNPKALSEDFETECH